MPPRLTSLFLALPLTLAAPAQAQPDWGDVSGDGSFGTWVQDGFDLPAYDYTLDQATDPRAVYETGLSGGSSRDHWFQLGNDRLVAVAHVDGVVEIFDLDDAPLVRNHRDDDAQAYGGGFGYLVDAEGPTVYSTHHDDLPRGAVLARRYGVDYAERWISVGNWTLREVTFAPFGDVPALVHQVWITNEGNQSRSMSYAPYFDVNLYQRWPGLQEAGGISLGETWPLQTRWNAQWGALFSAPEAEGDTSNGQVGLVPPAPPIQLLAPVIGEVVAYDGDQRVFFGEGSRATPDALVDGWADGSQILDPAGTSTQPSCLVLQSPELNLATGETATLAYVYAFTDSTEAIAPLVEELRDTLEGGAGPQLGLADASLSAWSEALPRFEIPDYPALARELTWSAWMLRGASLWSRYADRRTVTQGGAYVYDYGLNAAPRDPLQHSLALSWVAPELARETLLYWMAQARSDGHLPYSIFASNWQSDLVWKPSDLNLWLLLAATEYVTATGDTAFLDTPVPYFPAGAGESATALEHLKVAWEHLVREHGPGRHGLLKLGMYDWNDALLPPDASRAEVLLTRRFGESTLNTAMGAYALPRFADLVEEAGDAPLAEEVRTLSGELTAALRRQWRDDHLNRAYVGRGEEIGADILYLEPQPWAFLVPDLLNEANARALIEAVESRLADPGGLGSRVLETPHEEGHPPGELTNGGVWASVNGWLAWGAGTRDGEFGFEELLRNTLAHHATIYPDQWWGIWGGPDSYNAGQSERPGETWWVDGFSMQAFPIQNLHPHAWPLFAALRLGGVTPTRGGLTISPRWPLDRFEIEAEQVELSVSPARLRVRHRRPQPTPVTIAAPAGWSPERRSAFEAGQGHLYVNGERRTYDLEAGRLTLSAAPGSVVEIRMP